jgi:hypothetical protein
MDFVYILSNDARIVKATRCLDESTLWDSIDGNGSVEVPLSNYTELSSVVQDDQIIVQNEDLETIATLDVETFIEDEEYLLGDCSVSHYTKHYEVGRISTNGTLLEKLNLTKDLETSIKSDSEEIAHRLTITQK